MKPFKKLTIPLFQQKHRSADYFAIMFIKLFFSCCSILIPLLRAAQIICSRFFNYFCNELFFICSLTGLISLFFVQYLLTKSLLMKKHVLHSVVKLLILLCVLARCNRPRRTWCPLRRRRPQKRLQRWGSLSGCYCRYNWLLGRRIYGIPFRGARVTQKYDIHLFCV
jgi:hypothetical protein